MNTVFGYSVQIFNQIGEEIRKPQEEQYLRPSTTMAVTNPILRNSGALKNIK
jgi:hypothetical protein